MGVPTTKQAEVVVQGSRPTSDIDQSSLDLLTKQLNDVTAEKQQLEKQSQADRLKLAQLEEQIAGSKYL